MRVTLILLVTLALIALIEAAPAEKKGKTIDSNKAGKTVAKAGKTAAKAGKTAAKAGKTVGTQNKKGSRGLGSDDDAEPDSPARESRSANERAADPVAPDAEAVRKARSAASEDPADESDEAPQGPAMPGVAAKAGSRFLGGLDKVFPVGKALSGGLGLLAAGAAPKKKPKYDDDKK